MNVIIETFRTSLQNEKPKATKETQTSTENGIGSIPGTPMQDKLQRSASQN